MMKRLAFAAAGAVALVSTGAEPAVAQSISGSVRFVSESGLNFFDPQYNLVPKEYGNASGTKVKIGNRVEFGFEDAANLITADFTGNTLTIKDVTKDLLASDFFMAFSSDVPGFFNNAKFTSNGFDGSIRVVADTLYFDSPLFRNTGTRTATIEFTGSAAAVPEPTTWAMMLVGFGMVGFANRRRRCVRVRYSA